jgi:hypothetical protein
MQEAKRDSWQICVEDEKVRAKKQQQQPTQR